MEGSVSEVFDRLCEAGVDPDAVDSWGMTAKYYLTRPHIGSQEIEETTRWLWEMHGRYVLQEISIWFQLRESSAQSARDNLRFFANMNKASEKNKK